MKHIEMNRVSLMALIIVVGSGLIGATPFLLNHTSVETAQQEFNASVNIVNDSDNRGLGINADRNLDFGRLKTGANATKFVNISIGKKSVLKISSEGNISEVLEYEKLRYVQGDEEIELEAKGREVGKYNGTVRLDFDIPRNKIGEYWLYIEYKLAGM
jgi:hypothetical protein